MPTEQCILQVDQEKIYICSKTVFSDSNAFISCVSAAMSMKGPGNTYVGFCSDGKSSADVSVTVFCTCKTVLLNILVYATIFPEYIH